MAGQSFHFLLLLVFFCFAGTARHFPQTTSGEQ